MAKIDAVAFQEMVSACLSLVWMKLRVKSDIHRLTSGPQMLRKQRKVTNTHLMGTLSPMSPFSLFRGWCSDPK